jgi:uncharacterized membrane protein
MHMLSPNAIHPVVVEKARKLTADFSNYSWPILCGMNQAVTETAAPLVSAFVQGGSNNWH